MTLVAGVRKHRRPGQRPGVACSGEPVRRFSAATDGCGASISAYARRSSAVSGWVPQADPLQFLTYTGHIEPQDIEHSGEQVSQLHLLGHPLSRGNSSG